MIRTYADGSTLELGCGNTHPPGWTGQHGNVNRTWARMNGGEWHCAESRSAHMARFWMEAAEGAAEAFALICPSAR